MIYALGLLLSFYGGLFLGCLLSRRRISEAEYRATSAEWKYSALVETVSGRTDQAKAQKEVQGNE
jgi:hypothetical protein